MRANIAATWGVRSPRSVFEGDNGNLAVPAGRVSASRRSGVLGGTNRRIAQASQSLRISSGNALVVRAISSGALALSHGGVHTPHTAQGLEAERCAPGLRGGGLRHDRKRHDHGGSGQHFHKLNPFVAISRSTDETGDCSACVPCHQPLGYRMIACQESYDGR